ncbi:unnamed protein product [Enterobius vermicularis]|uniref:Uncharacterized protein n=1 Tax=Enterobius vermicularis TaxID=51028 RepID=A0A0N4VMP3_ENTVE|nr:unnamed protein product [Enterobius vermicularis]
MDKGNKEVGIWSVSVFLLSGKQQAEQEARIAKTISADCSGADWLTLLMYRIGQAIMLRPTDGYKSSSSSSATTTTSITTTAITTMAAAKVFP